MSKLKQVLILGGLVRFVIPTVLPQIVSILSSINEISTPVNSFKSLQEAFYYLRHNINLYDGGVNHNPPLLVVLLSLFDDFLPQPLSAIAFNLIYTLIDLYITTILLKLNKWYNEHNSKRLKKELTGFNDDLIASFYLFNPLIILTNLSHSTSVFTFLFITESLNQLLIRKNVWRSMIALGLATYLSFSPVFLVFPILALAKTALFKKDAKEIYFEGGAIFISTLGLLFLCSFATTASFQFLDSCYGTIIMFNKISPNLGLWWYIFTEMFQFFTPFYIGIFNLYSSIFILPLTLRLYEFKTTAPVGDSFLAVVLSYIWISFTKSYPTVGDLAFGLSLLPIFKATVFPYCKFTFIYGLTLLVCLFLSPIFYYCWIVLGNGNSNFFYSINLIWGAVHIFIIMDLLWGKLTYDYIVENKIPEGDREKLRLTQI
ncbi:GPI transamidase subunit PIG-U [Scheffersomyces xylosifermentans]|uniref:GPI transamidase subunit PIG-U n=1 Tax=Scheffersomyces xylosifermentans TaxID=1304137 RepID=UPI00315D836D